MSLSCAYTTYQRPLWKFSNSALTNNYVVLTSTYSTLIINNVTLDYAGPIHCSAYGQEYSLVLVGKIKCSDKYSIK